MEYKQDDYSSIINKGKRSKRPRPSSPALSLTMASTSSTTTATAATEDDDHHPQKPHHTTAGTIGFTKEEDMANSLILLAQTPSSPQVPHKVETSAGYECKTCNRGFSSFQALGGHRASHKKPCKVKPNSNQGYTNLSLQIGCSQMMSQCKVPSGSTKVTKVHECSICGAEFGSGQALGGHMRRHRSMPMATANGSGGCQESKKPKTGLPLLDLNLPAPTEDDVRESKFPFQMKDQMIVFSNSSLVHCHF